MSFIGNTPTQQAFTAAVDVFSGNGSTTAFTLSRPVASVAQVQAFIENVPQSPVDAFTVNGGTITFTSAPPSGSSNIYVRYTSPITQVISPTDGSVGTSALAAGAVTDAKLAAGAARANFGAGAVLQVVQASTSTSTSSTSTSYSDVAGLTATITPSSSSNKILILVDYSTYIQADNSAQMGLQIVRNGGTVVWNDPYANMNNVNANVAIGTRGSICKLDSPATTTAQTYKAQLKRSSVAGTGYAVYINGNIANISTITLLEIAA